jgi:hypothetical protein
MVGTYLIALFNAVAILCPYCDLVTHWAAPPPHGFLPPNRLLLPSTQQPPILIYPDGIDGFTCPHYAECED